MAEIITIDDLPESVAAQAMALLWVDGANARASRVAPCLDSGPTDGQLAEAKLILVGAVVRWSQAGSGAFQSQSAGPYSVTVDTRQRGGFNLWPSEITQLQDICKSGSESQAYSVDTVGSGVCHALACSINFGGPCSCGVDVAGEPIYECP